MAKNSMADLQKANTQEKEAGWIRFIHFLPEDIRGSFSDKQLKALKSAITADAWSRHALDIRGAISFFSYRYYYVLIAGREQRAMSRGERRVQHFTSVLLITVFLLFCSLLGLLVLYLLKSALGIDIFPDFSLGVWDWFRELWQ